VRFNKRDFGPGIAVAFEVRPLGAQWIRRDGVGGEWLGPDNLNSLGRELEMLVLSRKIGEKVVIGEGIVVVVKRILGQRVTFGIEAPETVRIVRGELPRFDTGAENRVGGHVAPMAPPHILAPHPR
jgi:carbon storage regulator CsrA